MPNNSTMAYFGLITNRYATFSTFFTWIGIRSYFRSHTLFIRVGTRVKGLLRTYTLLLQILNTASNLITNRALLPFGFFWHDTSCKKPILPITRNILPFSYMNREKKFICQVRKFSRKIFIFYRWPKTSNRRSSNQQSSLSMPTSS